MKYHIVLDTNVIVSALITGNKESATVRLLGKILQDDSIVLLINDEILTEYQEVLHRPKFSIDPVSLNTILNTLQSIACRVDAPPVCIGLPDPKDVMFVKVSMSVDGSTIVTGNIRHFPNIHNVMTPAQFLEFIENNQHHGTI